MLIVLNLLAKSIGIGGNPKSRPERRNIKTSKSRQLVMGMWVYFYES